MSYLDYTRQPQRGRRVVISFRTVANNLRDLLTIHRNNSNYELYAEEDFNELLINLIMSYFSNALDYPTELLSKSLLSDPYSKDYLENKLADLALDLVDQIDSIAKLHFPHNLYMDKPPIDRYKILDIEHMGNNRFLIEIDKTHFEDHQLAQNKE